MGEAMGFDGFFDIDNLQQISQEELEYAVSHSLALVVFLHDETCESEWCRFEWKTAKDCDVPCLCIVDMNNCIKRQVVDQVVKAEPYQLANQFLEYTSKNRRKTVKEIATWLNNLA